MITHAQHHRHSMALARGRYAVTTDRDRLMAAANSVVGKLQRVQSLVRDGKIGAAAKLLVGAAIELTTLSRRAGELAAKQPAPRRVAKMPEPN